MLIISILPGVLILIGLSSVLLAVYVRQNLDLWQANYRVDFPASAQERMSHPSTRFLYVIHASSMPLIIALLLTSIIHEDMCLPELSELQPRSLQLDFAIKDAYWKRRIAYAQT